MKEKELVTNPDALFPGDVITSRERRLSSRGDHGIGVVSAIECASGCGYLVMFEAGWPSAQCTMSLVRWTDVQIGAWS